LSYLKYPQSGCIFYEFFGIKFTNAASIIKIGVKNLPIAKLNSLKGILFPYSDNL